MVGRAGYTTTFQLKADSLGSRKYGFVITGVLFNSFKTLQVLDGNEVADSPAEHSTLRIEPQDNSLNIEKRKSLKYNGISISDLKSIFYLPYAREVERHPSGEKKIPNIVYVETDISEFDENALIVSYLLRKARPGCELIQFEKEQLIGTLLWMSGRVSRSILDRFCYSDHDVQNNLKIYLAYLEAKAKSVGLTPDEKKVEGEMGLANDVKTAALIAAELKKAGLSKTWAPVIQDAVAGIMKAAGKFRPQVLLQGRTQVYWDVHSYIHITMAHVREFQVGKYKTHTSLPYKPKDVGYLIEKVLERISDEIALHFEKGKTMFRRSGGMAVIFNGDHFNLIIESDGRLAQFHSTSKAGR